MGDKDGISWEDIQEAAEENPEAAEAIVEMLIEADENILPADDADND